MNGYSLEQFEADIQRIKPRAFDTYLLPAFLIFYAMRSKKAMGKNARRILFTSGIYMFYRNYAEYKKLAQALAAKLPQETLAACYITTYDKGHDHRVCIP